MSRDPAARHDAHDHAGHHGEHPDADVHGMLVVGERTVYLSHLPMFGHPHHDVQAILEARLTGGGDDPQAAYAEDRRRTGERIYTLQPERFVLRALVEPDADGECLCVFTGTVYRGHFERGGTPILRDVTVTIDRVVHFRQFDPEAEKPVVQHYLLFGSGDEQFLAHLITAPPDFDQVVSVRMLDEPLSDDDLARGPELFFPRRANTVTDRLRPGERVSPEVSGGARLIHLEIGEELYFEEGELGVEFSQRQTEAEKLAGF